MAYAESTISSTSDSTKLSTKSLQLLRDGLTSNNHRKSTRNNYHAVWRKFNEFVIQLDHIPRQWEERVSLYCTYLIKIKGLQSSTVKSYVSAIKDKLVSDGYAWCDEAVLLSSLTKACKLENDELMDRLPIQKGLLEMVTFEMERSYPATIPQARTYEEIMYKCLYLVAYYGLFRISEITCSEHVVKAVDVMKSRCKTKYLFILRSSKTHALSDRPHKIRIEKLQKRKGKTKHKLFCPVEAIDEYIEVRPQILHDEEQFFIFENRVPVMPNDMRRTLKVALRRIGLDADLYDTHSFRIGRATDLQKLGTPIDNIKSLGRWRSNAVYNYLRK